MHAGYIKGTERIAGRRDRATAPHTLRRLHGTVIAAGVSCSALLVAATAHAQQVSQPGFDPRQTEKYFDDQQSRSAQPAPARPRAPQFATQDGGGDRKPLFTMRAVILPGPAVPPAEQIASAYQPYLGKPVSQA